MRMIRFLLRAASSPMMSSPATFRGKSTLVTPTRLTRLCNDGGCVRQLLEAENPEDLSKAKLVRSARHLDKIGHHEAALTVFQWMREKQMPLSDFENEILMDILVKTKGIAAGQDFYESLGCSMTSLARRKLGEWFMIKCHEENSFSDLKFAATLPPVTPSSYSKSAAAPLLCSKSASSHSKSAAAAPPLRSKSALSRSKSLFVNDSYLVDP
ncbi:unnamed protein product [Arabis nemorensis]|uniref:Pentacotripeptide-repeat region of PRORP domain-containing protein n=1 Tax=Arabis nemorensis TaxID=586526 RepID=A0A565C0N2_9BRAS|nr:unnamed protein product [Arabis nemorensis]